MKKWLWIVLLPLQVMARYDSDGDFQIWNRYTLTDSLFGCLSTRNDYEFRFGDRGSRLYYWYLQWGVVVRPWQWFEVTPSYRQGFRRLAVREDRVSAEGNPMVDITLFWRPGRWEIEDRTRIQYRFFFCRNLPDDLFYRNRLLARYRYVLGEWCFAPFLSDEVFVTREEGVTQNRIKGGGSICCLGWLQVELFYFFRTIEHRRQRGIGLYFMLSL